MREPCRCGDTACPFCGWEEISDEEVDQAMVFVQDQQTQIDTLQDHIAFLLRLLEEEQMCRWTHHVGGDCNWAGCTLRPENNRDPHRWR